MRIPWFVSFMVEDDFRLYFCANFEYASKFDVSMFSHDLTHSTFIKRTDNTVVVLMSYNERFVQIVWYVCVEILSNKNIRDQPISSFLGPFTFR